MRYVAIILFFLGWLILWVGMGLENCTQGATDKVGLGTISLMLTSFLSFVLFFFDYKKRKRIGRVAGFFMILLCAHCSYLGLAMLVGGEAYEVCPGWKVAELRKIYPSTLRWEPWGILTAGLWGSTWVWLMRRKAEFSSD